VLFFGLPGVCSGSYPCGAAGCVRAVWRAGVYLVAALWHHKVAATAAEGGRLYGVLCRASYKKAGCAATVSSVYDGRHTRGSAVADSVADGRRTITCTA